MLKSLLPNGAVKWLEDRRPARPKTVDWTFDVADLRARLKRALTEKNGHVYLCVPDLLPARLYRAAMAYWPRDEQFEQRPHSRTRITMEWLDQAPLDRETKDFWHRFGHEIVNDKLKNAITETFRPYLPRKFDFLEGSEIAEIDRNVLFPVSLLEGLNLDKGFGIGPHVDQNFIFVSSLFYMPADASQSHMGTMLFEPLDKATRTLDTTYIDPSLVQERHQFPFQPNTLASFLQTPVSFHGLVGKSSPAPRRSYQFNVLIDPATCSKAYDGRPIGIV